MQIFYFLFVSFALLLTSCVENEQKKKQEIQKQDTLRKIQQSDSSNILFYKQYDLAAELISRFANKVALDTLLNKITHQEKVKILTELNEEWDDNSMSYKYSDSLFHFKLKIIRDTKSNSSETNTIFFDGKTRINFKDYVPVCLDDKNFHCENYGFNDQNSLLKPKVIEVCGKKFLYANILFQCNGVGCGCNITFIYDLDAHSPVFLETFRILFDGFLISDFDNDGIPDLLAIGQSDSGRMKGFDLEEFEIKLVPYSYEKGRFKAKWDNRFQRPYCYELYSITPDYYHNDHTNSIYAITKDNWLRP
jgi:hypothetical protein